MANSNGWGDGSVNNNIGWGQGSNNTIGWGKSHINSWAGATDIDGGNLPSNSVAPALSGTAQEGQTLTCSTGTWSGSPTYTYQWKRNGNNITSATNSTYTLVTADVGQSIKCTVTATNFIGSATADSNTVTPTALANLLLDTYTNAAVGYSLRKLRTAYTGAAIRVRRSSDNAEQDINFVGGELDTASLSSFVGANNGFITTWYDQSGNANNATQTTIANQGQIVSSGSIVTDPNTGKISVIWSTDFYLFTGIALTQLMTMSAVVNRVITSGTLYPLVTSGATNPRLYGWGATGTASSVLGGTTVTHETSTTIGAYIMSALRNSSNVVKAWKNTTALTTGTASSTTGSFTSFGQISTTGTTGRIVEMIYWNNDKESSRTDIVTNQNDYWEVY